MQNTRTQHETSDQLCDRHPYYPDDPMNVARFAKEIRPDEVFEAYGDRCFPKLVRVFGNNELPPEKHAESAEMILVCIKTNDKRYDAVDAGVVQVATQRLVSSSSDVREVSARVLGETFVLHIARSEAVQAETLPALVNLLSDAYDYVRCAAAEALASIAASNEGVEELCSLGSAIESIVKSLPDPDSNSGVHRALLRALYHITQNRVGVEQSLAAKCEKQLMQLADAEPLPVLHVATNLALWPQGKIQLIEVNMLPVLGRIIRNSSCSEVCRLATSCILATSVHKQAKLQIGQEEDISMSLVESLSDPNKNVQTNATSAILSASEVPAVRDLFVRLMLFEGEVERVFGSTAAVSLIPLIRHEMTRDAEINNTSLESKLSRNQTEDNDTPKQSRSPELHIVAAMDVLVNLADSSDEARDVIFSVLHSVETVAALLAHPNPLIRRHARDLAKSLCVQGPSATAERRLRHYILKHADSSSNNAFSQLDDILSNNSDNLEQAINNMGTLRFE